MAEVGSNLVLAQAPHGERNRVPHADTQRSGNSLQFPMGCDINPHARTTHTPMLTDMHATSDARTGAASATSARAPSSSRSDSSDESPPYEAGSPAEPISGAPRSSPAQAGTQPSRYRRHQACGPATSLPFSKRFAVLAASVILHSGEVRRSVLLVLETDLGLEPDRCQPAPTSRR